MQDTDHPNTWSRNNLAMTTGLRGGRPKRSGCYKRALADCERLLGADHPTTLTTRNNLAMAYRAAGRTADAIPLYERTLADCERFMGADHPDTKAAREGLAALTSEPERHSHI